MNVLITVLVIVICVFLTLIVLMQNSKGGGLAANFSSSNQIMGVRKTADFLEKATWTLAGSLVFLCVLATFLLPPSGQPSAPKSILDKEIDKTVDPGMTQPFTIPATAPTEGSDVPAE